MKIIDAYFKRRIIKRLLKIYKLVKQPDFLVYLYEFKLSKKLIERYFKQLKAQCYLTYKGIIKDSLHTLQITLSPAFLNKFYFAGKHKIKKSRRYCKGRSPPN